MVVQANRWHFFRHFLRDARPAYTPEEMDRYIEAWPQPGAAAGMINYYRFSVRQSPEKAEAALRTILAPTLVIWGQRDSYLGPELAEPTTTTCPTSIASSACPTRHIASIEAERVTQLLTDFFAPRPASQEPLNADKAWRNHEITSDTDAAGRRDSLASLRGDSLAHGRGDQRQRNGQWASA